MRAVADETARASYDMLENLVYRASRLSLASRPGVPSPAREVLPEEAPLLLPVQEEIVPLPPRGIVKPAGHCKEMTTSEALDILSSILTLKCKLGSPHLS